MDDLALKSQDARRLRYADVDVEAERDAGRILPDELYVPQHLIDTNIRREQSPYVQYITQSPRAVILEDDLDPSINLALLERDLTKKIRFPSWQLSQFANIDGFQANGYGIMELVLDMNNPGELGTESVQYGDFSFISDTRDLQACEMVSRSYYFTKTRLLSLYGHGTDDDFNREQVERVIGTAPKDDYSTFDGKDRSLYKIDKVMFRVNGVVQVAWTCVDVCSDWLRKPRPLFIGRRKMAQPGVMDKIKAVVNPNAQPSSQMEYETQYPYFLFPYVISENDTISQLKGRVFLDQNVQEAVTSLLSSTITQARRSAGLYGSRDVNDPNDGILMEKNIILKSGSILNSKVSFTQLAAPDPAMFNSIQMLVSGNQNETSQVNFAVNNRKDSRKTAEEVKAANSQSQILSTVQVVLFSLALRSLYTTMCSVIQSRVLAGLIQVNQAVKPLYSRKFSVKPSGDVDVIERANLIQAMMQAWPIIQNTAAAQPFLMDIIEKMFPENGPKYLMAFQQAQVQAQSAQAQQQQQMVGMIQQLGSSIIELSKHSDYFSDLGKLHAFPVIEMGAQKLQQLEEQQKQAAGKQSK